MTPVENLKIGNFVAVVRSRGTEARAEEMWSRPQVRYDGEPLEVQAISLPFMAVSNSDGDIFSLDMRDVEVQKLNHRYVAWMQEATGRMEFRESSGRPESHDGCPRCGGMLRQRLTADRQWRNICSECGAWN